MEPLSLVFDRKLACVCGIGMCVSLKHGLVVVSAQSLDRCDVHVHSLYDGSFVRAIGSKGSGKGQARAPR